MLGGLTQRKEILGKFQRVIGSAGIEAPSESCRLQYAYIENACRFIGFYTAIHFLFFAEVGHSRVLFYEKNVTLSLSDTQPK